MCPNVRKKLRCAKIMYIYSYFLYYIMKHFQIKTVKSFHYVNNFSPFQGIVM